MNATKAVIMAMIVAFAMIGTIGFAAAQTTYDSSVTLENKNPATWQPITDTISATIDYNSAGCQFSWHAYGTAPIANTQYSLIYYADCPVNKNGNWGGHHPGALIGTMATDGSGAFDNLGSTELNMDLPALPDGNIAVYSYSGAPDNYTNAHGAKLWMVPSTDYNAGACQVTGWHPANFLFETDLITYADCDMYPSAFLTPDNATFYIGDGFNNETIPIMVLNATNAGSVDMTLTYNASLVSVTVADGDMDNYFYNAGTGMIRIGAYQGSNPGLNGDFMLVNVTLTMIGTGTDDFGITVTTYKDATPCGRSMPYDVDVGKYCTFLNGDVNGDGLVDIFDAMYLAKHIIGITGYETIIDQAADVDGSGGVDMADVSRIAKCVIGIPGYCPLD